MKILVPVKRVPDYEAKIRVKEDGSGIQTDGIKWIVNPFDEIAVEEALRIKEKGGAEEVVVISIGPAEAATQLRYAMAMGADSAIHIVTDSEIDSNAAASLLMKAYQKGDYGIIIMGKQSIDSDANQTAQILSTRLGVPQACFASKLVLEDGAALVTREVDGGLETIRVSLPCVVSTDLRLNEPRYAPLPGIMKAKKKPLDEIPAADLGVDLTPVVKILKMSPPPERSGGRVVESVDELVGALQNEAKVL